MSEVVWLTGCASGVGKHLMRVFVEKNYRVVATDIDIDELQAVAESEKWVKPRLLVRRLDVTSRADWEAVCDDVLAKWGKIDRLFNIAGYLKPGFIHETEPEQIDLHMDINVKGAMYGSQVVSKLMVRQGYGHIITIASMASLAPIPGIALYSASKYAVRAFSLALAEELRPRGVSVSVICPDAIETPMLSLQEDYEEAALTFSGPQVLTVEDIESVVFSTILGKKPLEVCIPWRRGALARLGNAFPGISSILAEALKKKGAKEQEKRKSARSVNRM
ncbi:MAG: 3-ketoacyl-ACP reductase [Proteobacteria bacterium]|nr:MAG: 3-ketoacyl-ACP reductase [Pseudomonadota bacterium]